MGEDVDWEAVSFVKRSEQRTKVLRALKSPSMPSELAKKTGLHQSHVSRALIEMQEKKLVELLNPEDSHGRLYQRTEKGKNVLNRL